MSLFADVETQVPRSWLVFPFVGREWAGSRHTPLQRTHFSEDNLKCKGHQLSGQKEMRGLALFEFLLIFQLPKAVSLLIIGEINLLT